MTLPLTAEAAARIDDETAHLELRRLNRPWRYTTKRGNADSLDAYELALTMPDAAHALALLRVYAEFANLADTDTWSISALPKYSGPTDERRFATINGGAIELFYVCISTQTGHVTQWVLRLASAVEPPAGTWSEVHARGDVHLGGASLADLLSALGTPDVANLAHSTRLRRQGRRHGWHNAHLAAYVLLEDPPASAAVSGDSQNEEPLTIERRYAERLVRQRLHQRWLRARALRHYENICAYCGTNVLQTLETAHLLADSAGGAASIDNVRLLCANHHRAFDAGLLVWDGAAFGLAREATPIPPLPPGSGS